MVTIFDVGFEVVIAFFVLVLLWALNKIRAKRKVIKLSRKDQSSIAFLGTQNCGKTVLFSALHYVLGSGHYSDYTLEYQQGLKYVQQIKLQLDNGQWPAGTAMGQSNYFDAVLKKRTWLGRMYFRLQSADISGEAFSQAFDVDQSQIRIPPELQFVGNSKAIVLIMDPEAIAKDYTYYYGFIQQLCNMHRVSGEKKLKLPVAVILSKSDKIAPQLAAAGGPEGLMRQLCGPLLMLMQDRVHKKYLKIFAASAVGSTTPDGRPRPPIIPEGIGEVFDWVISNVDPHHKLDPLPPSTRSTQLLNQPGPAQSAAVHQHQVPQQPAPAPALQNFAIDAAQFFENTAVYWKAGKLDPIAPDFRKAGASKGATGIRDSSARSVEEFLRDNEPLAGEFLVASVDQSVLTNFRWYQWDGQRRQFVTIPFHLMAAYQIVEVGSHSEVRITSNTGHSVVIQATDDLPSEPTLNLIRGWQDWRRLPGPALSQMQMKFTVPQKIPASLESRASNPSASSPSVLRPIESVEVGTSSILVQCSNCKALIPENSHTCPQCGASFEEAGEPGVVAEETDETWQWWVLGIGAYLFIRFGLGLF